MSAVVAALWGLLALSRAHLAGAAPVGGGEGQCAGQSCIYAPGDEEPAVVGQAGDLGVGLLQMRKHQEVRVVVSGKDSDPDYDCNGDGVDDCGKWDYQVSKCANRVYCSHSYKYPDATLDDSCRCHRCNDPSYNGTAFWDTQLQRPDPAKFDALPWGTWRNWADHMRTCAPWVMPKDDAALQKLLAYARQAGYKVRISGAAHSAGGLVTDGLDSEVVVVSLAEYTAPGEWEFGMTDLPDGSKRATVNAGWTQMHLYAKIRPQGYFLPAQTAGYFFALGGIVANSVHGGAYNAGFVHSYVTRLRVMDSSGTIRIVDQEEELRYWRNSFGVLGLILGIEFQLEKREPLKMYSVVRGLDDWTEKSFWEFILNDAEADVPPEAAPAGSPSGTRASWNGEYFVDYINGDVPTMAVYAQKANASAPASRDEKSAEDLSDAYDDLLTATVNDDVHGRMMYGQSARRDGAPPINILGTDVNDLIGALKSKSFAKLMSQEAIMNIPRLVRENKNRVNDGFFLLRSPAALAAAYFVEPSKAFAAMDFLRQRQLEGMASRGGLTWGLPGEFRFVHVQDKAVLQPVPAGLWFNAQMIAFPDLTPDRQVWKRAFKEVEDYWVGELGARPHMGKLWGFEATPAGTVEPFGQNFTCALYSDKQKATFDAYRRQVDPVGLFAQGLGIRLLQPCSS